MPKKVPKIRFKKYIDEWDEDILSEFLEVSKEKNFLEEYDKIDVLSVSGECGIVNQIEHKGRSFAGASVANYGVVDTGDVVYTKSPLLNNPYGIIKTNKGKPGIVSTLYAVYKPKENVDPNFIECYFEQNARINNYLKPLVNKGAKNDMKVTDENALKGLVIFPCRKEQENIAVTIENINKIKDYYQKKLDILVHQKETMLCKMFPYKENKPEIRFNKFSDNWNYYKLGDIGDTYTGLSGKSKNDFGHGDAQYVTYMNVFNNTIANTTDNDKVEIDLRQNQVHYGDIFFTTSSETPNEVGMSSVWLGKLPNVYLNSFCFGYRLNKKVDLQYMGYMLRSKSIREKISFLAQGFSRYNLSKNKLMEIYIPIPTTEAEQKMIGQYFVANDKLINFIKTKLTNLEIIKKSFLEQMFVN